MDRGEHAAWYIHLLAERGIDQSPHVRGGECTESAGGRSHAGLAATGRPRRT